MTERKAPPVIDIEVALNALHPTGRCRCAGEGHCEWCTTPTSCGCTNATCPGCGAEEAEVAAALHYPLYCVDRGDRVDPEHQYLGPYTTHEDALVRAEDSRDLVRRCRQLRPSEIAFDRDAASLAEFEVFSTLVNELDEAATSGNLPEGAWHRIGERAVFDKYDDGTFPTSLNYDTWVNDHLSVDAWICEGDE